jgi:hypothetical protein
MNLAPTPKKPKKLVTDVNCKFKEIWAIKMPWLEPIFNEVGVVSILKCCVYTKIKKEGENSSCKVGFY